MSRAATVAGFLSDAQVARSGRFVSDPSAIDLERFFRLNGQALRLVEAKRRDHNRLGFGLPVVTARGARAPLSIDRRSVIRPMFYSITCSLGVAHLNC